jgi:hypothetical protein
MAIPNSFFGRLFRRRFEDRHFAHLKLVDEGISVLDSLVASNGELCGGLVVTCVLVTILLESNMKKSLVGSKG